MSRLLAIVTLPLLLAAACGSSTPVNNESFVTCETETSAKPYEPGMSVTSIGSAFTVSLLEATPAPPRKNHNSWVIRIADTATGTALDGLEVTVAPFMPAHQHGTRPVEVIPADAGTYELTPLHLIMSGVWEVRIDMGGMGRGTSSETGETVSTTASDLAIIPICIP